MSPLKEGAGPVIASFPWSCQTCGESGFLNMATTTDVLGLMGRVKRMHREAAPSCTVEMPWMGDQQEPAPDAVCNDPRERDRQTYAIASPRASLAARAILMAGVVGESSIPGSLWAQPARTRTDRLASRPDADSRITAAEAKRKRKAEKRLSGALSSPKRPRKEDR